MALTITSGHELTAARSSSRRRAHGRRRGTAVVVRDAGREPRLPAAPPAGHRSRPRRRTPARRAHGLHALLPLDRSAASGRSPRTSRSRSTTATPGSVRLNNLFIGIGIALALLAIGIGAVHWGKALMHDQEGVDLRHPIRGTEETRARAAEIFRQADEESGFSRRTLDPQQPDRRAHRVSRCPPSCCSAASRPLTGTRPSASRTRCGRRARG